MSKVDNKQELLWELFEEKCVLIFDCAHCSCFMKLTIDKMEEYVSFVYNHFCQGFLFWFGFCIVDFWI